MQLQKSQEEYQKNPYFTYKIPKPAVAQLKVAAP